MASSFVNQLVSGQLAASSPYQAALKPNPPAAAPAAANNGYFWQGANGQVYVQGSKGINAAGAWDPNTVNYWSSRGYKQTPNSPTTQSSATNTAPTSDAYGSGNTTASGGSSAASTYQDKSGDITVNNAALGGADQAQNAGIAATNAALAALNAGYDTEAAANNTNYTNESNTNMNQLQTNKQTALVHAAQGRQGLLATLASIGALSGDSINEANQAVQTGANEDLTGSTGTFATNQSALDSAINNFKAEDKLRRDQAVTDNNNNITTIKNNALQAKQTAYKNISNDYQLEGDTANGSKYAQLAASLYPDIANTSTAVTNLNPVAAAYTSPTLANYLAGNNSVVETNPNSGQSAATLPSLYATGPNKKQVGVGV